MTERVNPRVLRAGLRVLGVAIRTEPLMFTLSVVASALYGGMTVASAWVLGEVTERVILPAFAAGETTKGALAAGGAAIVAVSVLKALGVAGRRFWAGLMQYNLQARFRRSVTRQYLRLPLAWHHRHPTGQLLSNASSDIEAAWAPIAPLPMAVGVVFMLVFAAFSILAVDLPLAVVGFLLFPLIALLNLVYQRVLSPRVARAQQLRAEVSEVAHESFEGGLVVKTLGREAAETERFRTAAERLRDANVDVGRVRGLFDPVLESLPRFGVLAVLLFGSMRLDAGAIDTGDLVQVCYLFTLLSWPVRSLGWVLAELPRSVVGWDRVRAVLDAEGAMPYGKGALAVEVAARLEAEDLTFGYADDTTVLSGASLSVAPGRTVAVVGPTGSGKSTLASLLVRLVDPRAGAVRLDGTDVRDLAPGEVARAAALVPQDTFLFDDTVRGNVDLEGDLADADLWAALRLAQADGFVAGLPDGLDTRLGERGATLSGGQRQRLALARALVRRPRLLVLDDATSSVDPQIEERILGGLRESAASVVVVAYRKATISLADEVVHLVRGRVADRGTHAELLARSAAYRDLVNAYEHAEAERPDEGPPDGTALEGADGADAGEDVRA
ncbi:ABC-type multidrug transport system fused ATPase/permease subunit [Actinocorallia herbida]|uniref:ABC-type multidrug transport system fused ATPase/permease subunit n=1 Tax=Actinocorallia herbida TaxID=58109 RepID=A0A3N1CRQ7_9ACTN|nr:ABC-type multidrug transport system fused ATPase/permease subunit [Actinocorallia herbida]